MDQSCLTGESCYDRLHHGILDFKFFGIGEPDGWNHQSVSLYLRPKRGEGVKTLPSSARVLRPHVDMLFSGGHSSGRDLHQRSLRRLQQYCVKKPCDRRIIAEQAQDDISDHRQRLVSCRRFCAYVAPTAEAILLYTMRQCLSTTHRPTRCSKSQEMAADRRHGLLSPLLITWVIPLNVIQFGNSRGDWSVRTPDCGQFCCQYGAVHRVAQCRLDTSTRRTHPWRRSQFSFLETFGRSTLSCG